MNRSIVIRERVYIPFSQVDHGALVKGFEHDLYLKEQMCSRCPELENRPNDICGSCPNYGGHIKLWRTWEGPKTGVQYAVVPSGHLNRVSQHLGVDLSDVIDLRARPKFRAPLKFTGRLYGHGEVDSDGRPRPDQVGTVAQWMAKGYGLIRAAPRTGKTVMATYIACQLGLRTLVIADQEELLKQFYWTWMGNPEKDRPAMTNAPEIERRTGRRVVGIVRTLKDLGEFDVALMNYQKFIRENVHGTSEERIVAHINKRYGLMTVDEAHGASAHAFASFLNRVDSRHKLGLTATPTRKDGRHFIARDILGPVTAVSDTVAMVPEIEVFQTGIKKKGAQLKSYHGQEKFLATNADRLNLIVQQVFKDLRAGHTAILLPVNWRNHQKDIVEAINRQAAVNRVKRKEDWPKDLAVAFHGEAQRQTILDLVDDKRRPTVLVSIRRMIRQGIDFARPTMLYVLVPMSGKLGVGAPLFDQLANRVCTPVKGKRTPVIKVFVDEVGISQGCFKGLFNHEIKPKLTVSRGRPIKYAITKENMVRALEIVNAGRREPNEGPAYGQERKASNTPSLGRIQW